jgi:hypothetical protein
MSRRNHSRRVDAPDGGHPGIGSAREVGGQREPGASDEDRWATNETGYVQGMFSEHPHASVMTAFGIGFGLGLLVTLLLSRDEERWFERYAPEAIRDLPDRLKHAKQRIASAVPSSIQHAGESLASYVPSSWNRW